MTMRIAGVAVAAGLLAYAGQAHAHIKMLKPTSAVQESSSGAPQKDPPCGPGSAEGQGTPSNAVTTYMEGEEITVEWTETVPHNGHFRISLAKDPSEFKDPKVNGSCQSAEIQNPPVLPVLADGLFPTTSDDGKRMFSQKVKLPAGFTCDKCTLQLIQFMTPHPPSCFYYHCANIKIMPAGAAAGSGGAGGAAGTAAAGGGAAGASAGAGGSAVMMTGGAGSAAAAGGTGAAAGSTGASGMTGAAPAAAGGMSMAPPTNTTASAGKPAATTGSAGSGTGTTTSPQAQAPGAAPAPTQSSGGCSAASAPLRGNGMFGGLVVLGLALALRRKARVARRRAR